MCNFFNFVCEKPVGMVMNGWPDLPVGKIYDLLNDSYVVGAIQFLILSNGTQLLYFESFNVRENMCLNVAKLIQELLAESALVA